MGSSSTSSERQGESFWTTPSPTLKPIYDGLDVTVMSNIPGFTPTMTWFHIKHVESMNYPFYGEHSRTIYGINSDGKYHVRKRRTTFAGFVARMGEERLPRRMMPGDLVGRKGYSGRQEKGLMVCLEECMTECGMKTTGWRKGAQKAGR